MDSGEEANEYLINLGNWIVDGGSGDPWRKGEERGHRKKRERKG